MGEKIYNVGRVVGKDLKGNSTTVVKVVLNGANESVKTIYPL